MGETKITGKQLSSYLDFIAGEAAKADAVGRLEDLYIIQDGRAFAYNAAGDFVSTRVREGESLEGLMFRLRAGMFVGVQHG